MLKRNIWSWRKVQDRKLGYGTDCSVIYRDCSL